MFCGHVHRAISGNWRFISCSCMRGLRRQVALGLDGSRDHIDVSFQPPTHGVVLLSENRIIAHLRDFADASNQFIL